MAQNDKKPAETEGNLGDEIRAQGPVFAEKVAALARQAAEIEYPRLRGYAYESGKRTIAMTMVLECEFGASRLRLRMTTKPMFEPPTLIFRDEGKVGRN